MSDWEHYIGQHCESVATGTLLKHIDVDLSEPMLFGIGEGLSFVFLNLSSFPLPFIGGRTKPFTLTARLCANLSVPCDVRETSSRTKAWQNVISHLEASTPVGLQLDCFHLPYFKTRIHFAGHCVAALGCDGSHVFVVDTQQQGGVHRCAREDLEAARFERGPMAAKARSWTIAHPKRIVDLRSAVLRSIKGAASRFLHPEFKGASYLGIQKLTASLPRWLTLAANPEEDLVLSAMLIERGGTGGALFRRFYADFLREAEEYLPRSARPPLRRAHAYFERSAMLWSEIASLLESAARTQNAAPLAKAAECSAQIAVDETAAMRLLVNLPGAT